MNKYHAKAVTIDNVRFASVREASRYRELCLLLHTGAITRLELQPRFDIHINGRYCAHYKADFRYLDAGGLSHIEDAKGVRTAVYALKKKLVEALYGVTIEEV